MKRFILLFGILSGLAGCSPTVFIIKGFSGKPVSYFSEYAQENELLFARGSKFQVSKPQWSARRKVNYVLAIQVL